MNQNTIEKLEKLKQLQNVIAEAEAGIDKIFSLGEDEVKLPDKVTYTPYIRKGDPVRAGKKARLNDDDRNRIVFLFKSNMGKSDIAQKMNTSYATVCKVLAEAGMGGRGKRKEKEADKMSVANVKNDDEDDEFTQEQRNEIITQKNRGKDAEWIASYYHLDEDKVQEVIDSVEDDDEL